MARDNLAPTKSSLLRVKERLALAEEGHELLSQKREILVRELMGLLKEAKALEEAVQARVGSAYPALKETFLAVGRTEARDQGQGIVYDYRWQSGTEGKAGMGFTTVKVQIPAPAPRLSLGPGAAAGDRTSIEFQELLALAVPLAVVRSQVWRLARELKKTQRRVNALEKIVIPQEVETKAYIETTLEERDREAFFVSKLLKKRRQGA